MPGKRLELLHRCRRRILSAIRLPERNAYHYRKGVVTRQGAESFSGIPATNPATSDTWAAPHWSDGAPLSARWFRWTLGEAFMASLVITDPQGMNRRLGEVLNDRLLRPTSDGRLLLGSGE